MDQNDRMTDRGYYSIIRYRSDPIRGEFRNVAVLLTDEAGGLLGLRALRPGTISRTVEEHGLLESVIAGVERRIRTSGAGPRELLELAGQYSHSILFSDPQPAIAREGPEALLHSLYVALVAPRAPRAVGFTKGHILDRLARWFKHRGASFEIGTYLDDFVFDAILRASNDTYAMHIASFAARQLNERKVEQEVGHFLFAASHVEARCIAVVQPAPQDSPAQNRRLQERLARWFEDAGIQAVSPKTLRETIALAGTTSGDNSSQLELRQLAT